MPKRIYRQGEEIIRGPLRLVQPRWEAPEAPAPPVRKAEDEIVRLLNTAAQINEQERLKALRPPPASRRPPS